MTLAMTLILTKAMTLDNMDMAKTMTQRSRKKRPKTLNCDVKASSHSLLYISSQAGVRLSYQEIHRSGHQR